MKRIGKFLIIAVLILAASLGRADETSVALTVDKTVSSPGEPITAQITVSGETNPPRPLLTRTEGFEAQFLGTSSQIQIINGHYSASKTFQFLLTPREAGQFTVGPAEVVIDGKTYRSDSVLLTIETGAAPVASPADARDQAAFVMAEVSDSAPYVNQQIVYTFRFYSRVPLRGTELRAPDFAGFRKEQLGDVRHSQKVINGQAWDVSEIRWALFPISPGEIKIGATEVIADMVLPTRRRSRFNDPFFDNDPFFSDMFQRPQRKAFSADPIPIHVRPLPEEGKPSDFSGLVGSADIKAELSSEDVEVGESATLTLTVRGSGNIRDVPAPKLEGGPNFKTYDDQPSFRSETGGDGVRGAKIFKKAVVPLRTGEFTIPSFPLRYFDPRTGQYETASTDPIHVRVRPPSHPEAAHLAVAGGGEANKQEVALLAHDLMPLERGPSALKSQDIGPRERLMFLLIALVPLLGVFAAWGWRRRLERIRSDSGFLRREKAWKSAVRKIRGLPRDSDRDFPERAAQILRTFLGDKAGIDGGSLTPADVHPRLEPLRVSRETRDDIRRFLEDCDAALYGGQALSEESRRQLTKTLKNLIEQAGKEIRT